MDMIVHAAGAGLRADAVRGGAERLTGFRAEAKVVIAAGCVVLRGIFPAPTGNPMSRAKAIQKCRRTRYRRDGADGGAVAV
jgi:hypothetical protein